MLGKNETRVSATIKPKDYNSITQMDQLPFDVFNLSGTSNVKEKFKDDKMQIRDYLRLQDNVYKTSKSW